MACCFDQHSMMYYGRAQLGMGAFVMVQGFVLCILCVSVFPRPPAAATGWRLTRGEEHSTMKISLRTLQ